METSCATRGKFGTAIEAEERRRRTILWWEGERSAKRAKEPWVLRPPYHQPASLPACFIAKYHTLYYTCLSKKWETAIARCSFLSHTRPVYIYVCSGSTEYMWARKPPEEQKKYGELPWSRKNSASRGKYQLHVWTRSAAARHYLSTTLCFKERTYTHANTPSPMLFFYGFKQKREFCVCNDEASFSNFLILYSLQPGHGNFGLISFLW